MILINMARQMTWDEIKHSYPDEWVALADYERTGPLEVRGDVIAHHSNKTTFHGKVRDLMPQYRKIAVRYTGQLIKKPEIPLLWQISPTEPTKT